MHAIFLVNGKQVTPKALNPYWSKTARDSFDVDAIERQYRVLKKNGKILETTITASQVIHDD